jgi:hypothetical protein
VLGSVPPIVPLWHSLAAARSHAKLYSNCELKLEPSGRLPTLEIPSNPYEGIEYSYHSGF